MANPLKVVLDTNIIISALVFGGKPKEIVKKVQKFELEAYISPQLLSELTEVLTKKFGFSKEKIQLTEALIKKSFKLVYPSEELDVVKDKDDNRVLEAAIKGNCTLIITGDKELLQLSHYKNIEIITSEQFLNKKYKHRTSFLIF